MASTPRDAESTLTALIRKIAPDQQRLVTALRKAIRKRLPSATELIYEYADKVTISFSPNDKGYAGVLALQATGDEVRLYFNQGKELKDPGKLLQGTAKLVRWIPVESAATLNRPAVVELIDQAIARATVPFPKTGEGAVIVQSLRSK